MGQCALVVGLTVAAASACKKNEDSLLRSEEPAAADTSGASGASGPSGGETGGAKPLPTFTNSFDPMGCNLAGPQSPRDISKSSGSNDKVVPGSERTLSTSGMRICSVHFHRHAEHRSAGQYDVAKDGGFACNAKSSEKPEVKSGDQGGDKSGDKTGEKSSDTSVTGGGNEPGKSGDSEIFNPEGYSSYDEVGLALSDGNGAGNGVSVGDTVEFHWVHTTCSQEDIDNGIKKALEKDSKKDTGLGPCACAGGKVVVVGRVFTVTKDSGVKSLSNSPTSAIGDVVSYNGSSTGPKYNNSSCSPVQAGWNVDRNCGEVTLSAIEGWLADGGKKFNESHAHGARELVTAEGNLASFE